MIHTFKWITCQQQKIIRFEAQKAFWSWGMSGLHFFENNDRNSVMVNDVYYWKVIIKFLWPQWDSADSKICAFSRPELVTLHTKLICWEKFPAHLCSFDSTRIGYQGLVFWHHVTSSFESFQISCFVNKPKTIPGLEADIQDSH